METSEEIMTRVSPRAAKGGPAEKQARVPPLRYLALHKSAENGTSGFHAI